MRIAAVIMALLLTAGCCTCGTEIKEVNDTWNTAFNSFRLPTTEEVEQFDALDEPGKLAWIADGKPVLRPINPEVLGVVKDMYEANQKLASVYNDGNDEPAGSTEDTR